jgi:Fusaric acid resistance protein-like
MSVEIPNPKQSAAPSPQNLERAMKKRPISTRIWRSLRFLCQEDIRFACKVGIGAILYATISFIPSTRPFYQHWRGEWGLLSYMLVCSMTIGASNTTGIQRFLGTCLGAVLAVIVWIISNDNPFVLGFFGWLVSLGCFYIILGLGKGPMGRFILLTYNLSCLYAYSLSVKDADDDDDEGGVDPAIWEIVVHRVVAVMTGCLWGLIVTRVIWPISARKKLKHGISLLWLRMGLIWKRDPLSILIENDSRSSYMDIRESVELQRFLTHLQALRESAMHEFDLRGPFPDDLNKKILDATGRILGTFHAMNIVIVKDLKATPGEAEILRYTRNERIQLSARISHLFSGELSFFCLGSIQC